MSQANSKPPQRPTRLEIIRTVGKYLDLGFTFVAAIGGGALLGYWLDARWATQPWLLLTGSLLGIIVGFYHFFAVVLRK